MKQFKKYISILLALCMCLSATGVLAYAAPESEELPIAENADTNIDITPNMDILYDTSNLDEIDFATKRLVVLLESDSDLVNPEYVIGQYDNLYLLQYETIEQAMNDYSYYVDHNVTVEPDGIIYAADDADTEITDIEMSGENNPVQNAATLAAVDELSSISLQLNRTIALIDTGVDEEKAIDRVSVLDGELSVGTHGNEMADAIFTQNKSARIVSIRALDENGNGTVSSVVAAIQYAIDNKLDIINLSLEAKCSLSSAVLEKAIKNAADAGIYVVGSAGNDNDDVKNYIPGSIEEAYIVGSANEDGTKADFSNYGETVDYNVVSSSTSEAAALFSGYISAHNVGDIDLNGGLIYETNYVEDSSSEFVFSDILGDNLKDTGHRIRTKATFIDGTKDLNGITIDKVMATEEMSAEYLLFQKEYFSSIYDNGNKDYYVAYVDLPYQKGISPKKALDVAFARDNYEGEELTRCEYDYESGIAYIPRNYVDNFKAKEGEAFDMQIQLLSAYDSQTEVKQVRVPVTVENKLTGETAETSVLADVLSDNFVVSLVDAASASKVNVDSIEAFINDKTIKYTAVTAKEFEKNELSMIDGAVYDDECGELLIPISGAGVMNLYVAFDGVDVDVTAQRVVGNSTILNGLSNTDAVFKNINIETLANKINAVFYVNGYHDAGSDKAGTVRNGNVWGPGYSSETDGSDANWTPIELGIAYALTPIADQSKLFTSIRGMDFNNMPTSGLAVLKTGRNELKGAVGDSTLENLDWSFTSSVPTRLYRADCTHITLPYADTDEGRTSIRAKIVGVDTTAGRVAISFTSYRPPNAGGQTCSMALVFKVQPQLQDLTIEKQSSDTRVRLTGAQFTLHLYNVSNNNYNSTPIATSVDNGNGTYTFKNIDVSLGGNYLIKEVKAPTNYSNQYELYNETDRKQYTKFGGREIEWNGSAWVKHNDLPDNFLLFLDPPKLQNLTVEKRTSDTREHIAGAQFTLHLYNASNNTYYETPISTTVDNGNGTYTFQNIDVRLGGNYLIKEVKAPPGYSINYDLFNETDQKQYTKFGGREIEWNGSAWLRHGDLPDYYLVFLDPPETANLKINKVINEKDIWWAHGNPSFSFEVTGTDAADKQHAYNRMVTFTKEYVDANTDANGNITLSTIITNIPSGTYFVTEKKVSRFGLVDVTAQTSNITITKHETGNIYDDIKTITATAVADLRGTDGEITFFNRRITWDKYGHTDAKVNTFTIATN